MPKCKRKKIKMSKHEFDSDGFKIVTSKRSSKNKQTRIPRKQTQFTKEENYINVETSYQLVYYTVHQHTF